MEQLFKISDQIRHLVIIQTKLHNFLFLGFDPPDQCFYYDWESGRNYSIYEGDYLYLEVNSSSLKFSHPLNDIIRSYEEFGMENCLVVLCIDARTNTHDEIHTPCKGTSVKINVA